MHAVVDSEGPGCVEVDESLGAVLLSQTPRYGRAVFCLLAGLALVTLEVPVAPRWLLAGEVTNGPIAVCAAMIAVAAAGFFVAGVVGIWRNRGYSLALHQRGLRESRRGRLIVLRYEELGEVIYRKTRHYANGSYSRSKETLILTPGDRSAKTIRLDREWRERAVRSTAPVEATGIEQASFYASIPISVRLSGQVARGETVSWTPRMRLSSEGLEHSRWAWQRRHPRDLIPALFCPRFWLDECRRPWSRLRWEDIDRVDIEQGFFRIWAKGCKRPSFDVSTGLANFHPGYAVFETILKDHSRAAEGERSFEMISRQ